MKYFRKTLLSVTALCGLLAFNAAQADTQKIGIIMPMEVTAMHEIIKGFETTLQENYKKPVEFKIENAQNDSNLERAIIAQMHDANYAMIVPIGTGATEMSLAMIKNQPIVSLASDYPQEERSKRQPCNVVAVHDEISADQSLAFIHAVYPQIKYITLVHSASDKVFPEVKQAQQAAAQYGIQVKPLMMQNLADLYSISQSLPSNTQAIFVLKDSPIVSGINTLAKVAVERHIPLITSDQGSVQDSAGFAVGVHEQQIGIEGGKLAAQVLNGKDICSLPMVDMTHLTVFINKTALQKMQQPINPIIQAAKKMDYAVEIYSDKNQQG